MLVLQAAGVQDGEVEVVEVHERCTVFCEHVGPSHLRSDLVERHRVSSAEEWNRYVQLRWGQDAGASVAADGAGTASRSSAAAQIDRIVRQFEEETEEWARRGRFRRQGRSRAGGISDVMARPDVAAAVRKAGLLKEEMIVLRLYTGPMCV